MINIFKIFVNTIKFRKVLKYFHNEMGSNQTKFSSVLCILTIMIRIWEFSIWLQNKINLFVITKKLLVSADPLRILGVLKFRSILFRAYLVPNKNYIYKSY